MKLVLKTSHDKIVVLSSLCHSWQMVPREQLLRTLTEGPTESSLEATLCSSTALINIGLGDIYVSEQEAKQETIYVT